MKALYVLAVLVLTALSSAAASGQWYKVSNEGVLRVKFADSLNGVAASAGFVAVTHDGGLTWVKPELSPRVWYLGLSVLNNRVMYASGTGPTSGFTPAVVAKTIDGGKTWEDRVVSQAQVINDVSFVDSLEGWGAGSTDVFAKSNNNPYPGIIVHTVDGFKTSETQRFGDLRHMYNVVFVNKKLGIACGNLSQIARTIDGGSAWQVNTLPETGLQLGPMSFIDEKNGWLLATDFLASISYVYRTTNAGETWDLVYRGDNINFYSLQMLDNQYGLASGQSGSYFDDSLTYLGTIWETRDGGYTWTVVYQNTVQRGFYSISFLTRDLGWVGGFDGIVKYTTTPPPQPTAVEETVKGVPAKFSLAQNYPNPFNPETIIGYSLPVAGQVHLIVYDTIGQEVATLVNGRQEAGAHQVLFIAGDLPSGTYIYRLTVGEAVETKKMVLLK